MSTDAFGEVRLRSWDVEGEPAAVEDGQRPPMTHLQQVLARNVKRARKRLGLSQAALAERCDCSASFVSEVERARKYPSADALERISEALRLRPYQLFLDEDEWEVRDRIDSVADMYRDLKTRLNAVLEDALRRHSK